ncbi:MAG: Dam family site-specific DNA-(adenine-N6)-methyltransferase [Candidatus Cloacimonadota bacterium]|nr:Dam family site-specific DNA-(adenine-N6)-methyltransferase [Candidatus Cloacimonadota bacterium]
MKKKNADLYKRNNARPFLKWAGGKTQLLENLEKQLPIEIKKTKKIKYYVEPFIGGGAFFFYLKNNYEIENAFISDINKEIIVGYQTIQKKPNKLVDALWKMQKEYLAKSTKDRENYFYKIRKKYNQNITTFNYKNYNNSWITRTCQLIFLNKTCFNGLFRQNRKGEFNVPSGKYKNPKICDEVNLIAVNRTLQNTEIKICDFAETQKFVDKNTLVYLDPPYRPLNNSSSFTSYSKDGFDDDDQIRLSKYYKQLDEIGADLILSNSDPKNHNPNDNFFDNLYNKFSIQRVKATRMINSNAQKRGQINEIIIANY